MTDKELAAKVAKEAEAAKEAKDAKERAAKDRLVFKKEARRGVARHQRLLKFTGSSTKAAAIMLLAAVVSLAVANSSAYEPFLEFFHQDVGFVFGDATATMSLAHVINDIFMAVFFLLVGLEIKYEMTVGELTNIRQALLPILAACGGVLAPIVIYLIFNLGNPETGHGWGVPTATDIAFALGIMSLLGNRVPNGVRVFLSTLAVADDIIAILVIAIFYGQSPSAFWLACAAGVMVVLIIMNRRHVYSLTPYILVGLVLWYCVFRSGVHSTIAGVLLAFTIPTDSRIDLSAFISWSGGKVRKANAVFDENAHIMGQKDYLRTVSKLSAVSREVVPPATRLEHKLYPWVYFAILPLFALTNADVSLTGGDVAAMLANPALWGIFFGLLLGKPIGIMLFSFLVVKFKIASLPENVTWTHMLGAAILGGVGFTMAIFVANLAYDDAAIVTAAKLGILSASLVAGVLGFLFLMLQARKDKKQGVSYLVVDNVHDEMLQTADAEAARETAEMLEEIESPLLREEIEAAKKEGFLTELVVDLGEDGMRSDAASLLNEADEKRDE